MVRTTQFEMDIIRETHWSHQSVIHFAYTLQIQKTQLSSTNKILETVALWKMTNVSQVHIQSCKNVFWEVIRASANSYEFLYYQLINGQKTPSEKRTTGVPHQRLDFIDRGQFLLRGCQEIPVRLHFGICTLVLYWNHDVLLKLALGRRCQIKYTLF